MKTYQAASPRVAISIAAVAMTALTLGLSILPANVKLGGNVDPLASASHGAGPAAVAASGEGRPIIVYGVREEKTAMQKFPHVVPPRKHQS